MKKINWQYTFGEILIVIIGITIAFSLNKCADNSKSKSLKQQYLSSLINDIESDKIQLEGNVKAIESKIKKASKILPLLNINAPEKKSLINDVFSISEVTNFEPNNITYQTLINSGDLKLIDDFTLKTAIEKHYSNYKKMLKEYERQENIHKTYLGDYFIHNVDYDAFRKGEFGFKNEALLKNIVYSMRGSFLFKKQATENGIKSCDSLLSIITTSIK